MGMSQEDLQQQQPGAQGGVDAILASINNTNLSTGPQQQMPPAIGVPSFTVDANGNIVPFGAQRSTGSMMLGPGDPLHGVDTVLVPPRYFDGSQYDPAGLSAEKIARIQQDMVDAGLYPSNAKIRKGVWTDIDAEAYQQVLAHANQRGLDVVQSMSELRRNPQSEDTSPRQLPVYNITNPTDLVDVFTKAAQDVIGRKVDPEQLQRMVDAYHQAELAPQQQHAVATGVGTDEGVGPGGTITDAPSPTSFAEDQIRRAAPIEAGAHDVVNQFDSLLSIFQKGMG